jgi:hypothetical protein
MLWEMAMLVDVWILFLASCFMRYILYSSAAPWSHVRKDDRSRYENTLLDILSLGLHLDKHILITHVLRVPRPIGMWRQATRHIPPLRRAVAQLASAIRCRTDSLPRINWDGYRGLVSRSAIQRRNSSLNVVISVCVCTEESLDLHVGR